MINNPFIIAIPSYNRSQLIIDKTLSTLKKLNIPSNLINIFVANKKEFVEYKNVIPKELYNNIIIGKLGLKNQRNFINNYYPEGTWLVQMDDDIDDIMIISNLKDYSVKNNKIKKKCRHLISIPNLYNFITNAFKICKNKNLYLWGVYPIANAYFMNPIIREDLRFIVGPFWGCIVRHLSNLKISLDEKENVERSLLYYKNDGGVIRFDYVAVKTKYYKNPGGMQISNNKSFRKNAAEKSAVILHNKFPNLTKIKRTKKSGITELILRNSSK